MHFVHLKNPHRQNILSILRLLVDEQSEDTMSLNQIEQMCKCVLSSKLNVFIVLPLIHNQN